MRSDGIAFPGTARALDTGSQTWPRNGKGVFKQQPDSHHPPSEPLQPGDFVVAIASQYSNQGMFTAGRAAMKVKVEQFWWVLHVNWKAWCLEEIGMEQ